MLSLEHKDEYLEEITESLTKGDKVKFYVYMYDNFLYKDNEGFYAYIYKVEGGFLLEYLHENKCTRFFGKKKNQPKYIDAEDDCGNYKNYQIDLDHFCKMKWHEDVADAEIYSKKKFKSLNKLVDFLIEKF